MADTDFSHQPESLRTKLVLDAQVWNVAWSRAASYPRLLRLMLIEPGFQIVLVIRLQEILSRVPVVGRVLRRIAWYLVDIIFGCYIDPGAEIGGGIYMPHPIGIVIGNEVILGSNVSVLHGVTLGRRGTSTTVGPRVGDNVEINAGAVLLGPISVGTGAIIGANAVVIDDVPPGRIAVGIPARLLPRKYIEID